MKQKKGSTNKAADQEPESSYLNVIEITGEEEEESTHTLKAH